MACAFMCSYSTLPMIGTGCGISTDHLARSCVIGNGARPMCGMPASLATLDTAMVGGVVEHEDLERHAADLLRHEFERVALGNAERRRRAGRGDRYADGDFTGLRHCGVSRQ